MMNELFFAGKSLADFDAYVFERNVLNAPERVYSKVDVPGRNGSILFDEGRFANVSVEYSIIIIQNAQQNLTNLKNFILAQSGYKRLEDSYQPGEYMLARYSKGFNVAHSRDLKMVKVVLTFDRKPQRYIKAGEINKVYTSSSNVIVNPSPMNAAPLIRVYGSGTLTINDEEITIDGTGADYIDIDSELQDVYSGAVNKNNKVIFESGEFPLLHDGENTIELDGLTKVEIKPRWWTL